MGLALETGFSAPSIELQYRLVNACMPHLTRKKKEITYEAEVENTQSNSKAREDHLFRLCYAPQSSN